MRIDMRIDMSLDMCVGVCIDMYMDMCMDMRGNKTRGLCQLIPGRCGYGHNFASAVTSKMSECGIGMWRCIWGMVSGGVAG